MSAWVIAGLTFKEAARRKILGASLLLGAAFLALYSVGFYLILTRTGLKPGAGLGRQAAINFLSIVGLYAVNFMTVLMTVLTSVDTIAGEIASGTIQTVVTKPMRRWEVVLGKWLGYVGMLTLYILLMAGGVLAAAYLIGGHTAPKPMRGISLIWLESLLLLSVTFLCGTSFSALTTGVVAFGLHGLAFIGGWIEQFGAQLHSQTAVNVGIIASVIMPSEALWKRAAFEMQSPLINTLGISPFSSASVPSFAMIAYAGIYLAVALSLALRRFERRDL